MRPLLTKFADLPSKSFEAKEGDQMSCAECGSLLVGRQAKFCSDPCRYRSRDRKREWRPQMTCADCGAAIFRGGHSLLQGEATCRDCRRAKSTRRPEGYGKSPCSDCGSPAWGVRCAACDQGRRVTNDPAVRERRRQLLERRRERLRSAPGLGEAARRALRALWVRQGRTCAYCPAPATTIDHVVPLALGGSNREGNLAPACRSCNTRKNDSLLIEWRFKRMALAS